MPALETQGPSNEHGKDQRMVDAVEGSGSDPGDGGDPLVAVVTAVAVALEFVALVSHEAGAQAASLAAWVLRSYLDLRV
jgi:hypothetical protein